jgi:hypothetical protein
MSLAVRSVLIGALVLLGYYVLIFGYAFRTRAEHSEHVAWRFPLTKGNDLCADPLLDGTVVCSDNRGVIYFVGADGKERGRHGAYDSSDPSAGMISSGGYAWAGGTKDSLLALSSPKPPMGQDTLSVLESDGKLRWEMPLPPGKSVSWLAPSDDSIYILLDDATLQRYTLGGKLVYSTMPIKNARYIKVTRDNIVFVLDAGYANTVAVGPDGKRLWKNAGGGLLGLTTEYGGGDTLYCIDANYLRAFSREGKRLLNMPLGSAGPMGTSQPSGFSWRDIFDPGGSGYSSYAGPGSLRSQAPLADGGGFIYWIDDGLRGAGLRRGRRVLL